MYNNYKKTTFLLFISINLYNYKWKYLMKLEKT